MHQIKYALFYDFHTSYDYPEVGKNFNAEEFTDRLVRCGVDYLTFHARCNTGTSYYPTEIGIPHPGLNFDLFGELAEACQRKNIALTAYLNAGISQAEWLQHREWGCLDFSGKSLVDANGSRCTPMLRTMCYNSPYRDRLIGMVQEIARRYPISGFFLDCMSEFPCVCPTCVKEMQERNIDWRDLNAVTRFAGFSAARLAQDVSAAARAIKPDLLLYFNCVPYEDQAESGTYLECECIPSRDCWGYEYLPVFSHYMRTLGKPCVNMTGRFYTWGDFGGLRPTAALKSELLYGLANGMAPNIGDHFLPHGEVCAPVMDEVEKIYTDLHKLDPWLDDAQTQAEIAIVYPKPLAELRYAPELRGAVRLVSELQLQFDIVTKASSWEKYQVLILPDTITLDDPEILHRVEQHLAAGKKVIASFRSGLDAQNNFALPHYWGVKTAQPCEFSPAFFVPEPELASGIPAMPLNIYASGLQVQAESDTKIGAYLVKPLFNHEWTGIYPEYYHAPEAVTSNPYITLTPQVAYFSHAVFSGYKENSAPQTRQLFRNVMQQIFPDPLIKISAAPSFLRCFVTRQNQRDLLHLLAYLPEQRSVQSEIIEDELIVENLAVELRSEQRKVKAVYQAPDHSPLEFKVESGYIKIRLPRFQGHTLIAVEFADRSSLEFL